MGFVKSPGLEGWGSHVVTSSLRDNNRKCVWVGESRDHFLTTRQQ